MNIIAKFNPPPACVNSTRYMGLQSLHHAQYALLPRMHVGLHVLYLNVVIGLVSHADGETACMVQMYHAWQNYKLAFINGGIN